MKTISREAFEQQYGVVGVIMTHSFGLDGGTYIVALAVDWHIHQGRVNTHLPNGFVMNSDRPMVSGYWMSDDKQIPVNPADER